MVRGSFFYFFCKEAAEPKVNLKILLNCTKGTPFTSSREPLSTLINCDYIMKGLFSEMRRGPFAIDDWSGGNKNGGTENRFSRVEEYGYRI